MASCAPLRTPDLYIKAYTLQQQQALLWLRGGRGRGTALLGVHLFCRNRHWPVLSVGPGRAGPLGTARNATGVNVEHLPPRLFIPILIEFECRDVCLVRALLLLRGPHMCYWRSAAGDKYFSYLPPSAPSRSPRGAARGGAASTRPRTAMETLTPRATVAPRRAEHSPPAATCTATAPPPSAVSFANSSLGVADAPPVQTELTCSPGQQRPWRSDM